MDMILHSINYLLYCRYLNTVNWLSGIQASGILTNWQNLKKIQIIIFKELLQCCSAHMLTCYVVVFTVTNSSAVCHPSSHKCHYSHSDLRLQ
jgi:hypothetical protein